jgi:leucyl/phenylalanyl-tRNA--protein transferase
MFTRVTDASKVALAHAVDFLAARGIELIDCQVASAHTQSLGAVEIPRAKFLALIAELCEKSAPPQTWRFG